MGGALLFDVVKLVIGQTLYGLATVLFKKSSEQYDYPTYLLWTNIPTVLLLLPFSPLFFHFSTVAFLWLFLLACLYLIADYAYYRALSEQHSSIVAALTSFTAISGFLLSIALLNEPFNVIRFLGVIVGVAGMILIVIEKFTDVRRYTLIRFSTLFFCLIALFCWGLGYVVMRVATQNHVLPFQAVFFCAALFSVVGCVFLLLKKEAQVFSQPHFLPISAGALANAAFLFIIWGVAALPASLAAGMIGFSILVPFINDVLVEQKRISAHRYVGAILVVLGAILVVF